MQKEGIISKLWNWALCPAIAMFFTPVHGFSLVVFCLGSVVALLIYWQQNNLAYARLHGKADYSVEAKAVAKAHAWNEVRYGYSGAAAYNYSVLAITLVIWAFIHWLDCPVPYRSQVICTLLLSGIVGLYATFVAHQKQHGDSKTDVDEEDDADDLLLLATNYGDDDDKDPSQHSENKIVEDDQSGEDENDDDDDDE